MNAILILALTNAVLATGMFAIVAACKSRIHNPAVLHWLWILVLLKLLDAAVVEPAMGVASGCRARRRVLRGYDRFSPHESWCDVRSATQPPNRNAAP